jgi:hypothetical protein
LSDKTDRLLIEKKVKEARSFSKDPIKHYVRMHSWLKYAKRRHEFLQKETKKSTALRYLTLCGSDAIDIFHLYKNGILYWDGKSFPDVCFCESDPGSFADARSKLGGTTGVQNTFEEMILNSNKANTIFPFDLINLDFSGGCIPKNEPPFSDTLRAIEKIYKIQDRSFTLFVTFKADRSQDNAKAIRELEQTLEENIAKHKQFADLYIQNVKHPPDQLSKSDYCEFLARSFPKIVFGFAAPQKFKGTLAEVLRYQRKAHSKKYEIVKFIFEFDYLKPKTLKDGAKLAGSASNRYLDSICTGVSENILDVAYLLEQVGKNSVQKDLREVMARMKDMVPYAFVTG